MEGSEEKEGETDAGMDVIVQTGVGGIVVTVDQNSTIMSSEPSSC